MARLVASVLAVGYANHETGECKPGLTELMRAVDAPKRTVMRALADLQEAGWIARRGGEAPGRPASYAFRWPERVPEMATERVPKMALERVPEMATERVPETAPTGAISDAPPRPPYMEQPNMNQRTRLNRAAAKVVVPGGIRPTNFSQLVQVGTPQEAAWNDWLAERGFPDLGRIGKRLDRGLIQGWDMPWHWPPGDPDGEAVARRFAEWLRSRA